MSTSVQQIATKYLPLGGLRYCGGQDTPLDLFGDAAFYKAELREADMLSIYPNGRSAVGDVLFRLVGLPSVPFAFEPWVSGLFTLFNTAEETLIRGIQVLEFGLKRDGIYFFQPY